MNIFETILDLIKSNSQPKVAKALAVVATSSQIVETTVNLQSNSKHENAYDGIVNKQHNQKTVLSGGLGK